MDNWSQTPCITQYLKQNVVARKEYNDSISVSSVSYIQYRREDGSSVSPVFDKLEMANVILNDAGLQEDLNLDTPDNPDYNPEEGLDYWAVAKVGILTFADYIHDTYIADGGWREDTWNWIFDPGYTLVDLVNDIFSVAANAVSMIKAGVTSVMNAVKSGLEWIANAALQLLIDGIITVIDLILSTIFILVDSVFGIAFSKVGSIYSKDGLNFGIESNNLGMKLHLGDFSIDFSSFFDISEPSVETLAILDYRVTNAITFSTITHLVTNILLPVVAKTQPDKAVPIGVGFTATSIASQIFIFSSLKDFNLTPDEYQHLEFYYLISGLAAIGSSMISYGSTFKNPVSFTKWISLVVGLGSAGPIVIGSALNAYHESISNFDGSALAKTFNSVISFVMVVLTVWIGLLYTGFTSFADQDVAVSTALGIFNLSNGILYLIFRAILMGRLI